MIGLGDSYTYTYVWSMVVLVARTKEVVDAIAREK
jgi:hypothetical protein